MKKKQDLLGIFLSAVCGAAMVAALFARAFLPRLILPKFDALGVVVLCLIALVLDHYFARGKSHDLRWIPLYGALIFGIFPFAASFVSPAQAGMLAVLGAAVFTLLTFLFDQMVDRLATGPAAKLAPVVSAFVLYLAAQCLIGIL